MAIEDRLSKNLRINYFPKIRKISRSAKLITFFHPQPEENGACRVHVRGSDTQLCLPLKNKVRMTTRSPPALKNFYAYVLKNSRQLLGSGPSVPGELEVSWIVNHASSLSKHVAASEHVAVVGKPAVLTQRSVGGIVVNPVSAHVVAVTHHLASRVIGVKSELDVATLGKVLNIVGSGVD